MRIGMVGPFGFHPNKTMRSRAFKLAQELVVNGHSVKMLMPPWQTPELADRHWVEQGVDLRYVSLNGGMLPITRRLVRETMAWPPDVVHCFKPKAYSGLVAWWLWQTQRKQLRLVMDTDDWEGWGGWNELGDYSAVQKQFFAWQESDGMRHNHALTVASRELENRALGMGVSAEKVVYLPNGPGIDVGYAATPDAIAAQRAALGLGAGPVILLYSRLFEFDTARLVALLAAAKTAVADLQILAIGTGLFSQEEARLREQFASAEILDSIVDVGWVEESELPRLLALADVGIYLMDDTVLNRAKCPVKLADMAGMGIPVVGEAVGQVPEYVLDGKTGRLCASGDLAGLSDALISLLTQSDLRAQFSTAARNHIQTHFSWPILAQQLLSVYDDLLQP